ncbi:cold shock domain-containing protein [Paracoccus sp. TK19116]|uniref:Cold shock domain-containing protein n=1 Tax=Paracoccus albicereus TaxID=2922394 RepID=A0ABT1MQ82_9RHOB|nr:cold shock domain-containing protein [Paracoccus albicereus]MCQ0970361.1 cold shock domain-containing protein [Paracoccus albicereus]
MSDDIENSRIASGLIKWFDPAKGYGFVINSEGGPDILLHANVLRNFGQGSVADHARVKVRVVPTERGLQAVEVLEILPPDSHGQPPLADLDQSLFEHLSSLPLRPARVKWFDKHKGFGFANVFGHGDDLFLHIEVLRHSGLADLAPGEAIAVRVVEGPRGLMAAQIGAWDTAAQGAESLRLSTEGGDEFRETSLIAVIAE